MGNLLAVKPYRNLQEHAIQLDERDDEEKKAKYVGKLLCRDRSNSFLLLLASITSSTCEGSSRRALRTN